jgi:NDP-mannose synthase
VKRAIVLAGGAGTRLRPYTAVLPKPLMPVGDRPVLDIVLRQLARHGFAHVTIATGHLGQLIEAVCGDGDVYGLEVDYHREPHPLGTVGSLALIDGLDSDFLVMNGDVLTDMDYAVMLEEHSRSGAAATIATTAREEQITLGVIVLGDADDPQRITDYVEKPTYAYDVSMGVYCFSPRAVDHIDPGARLDFPDLVLRLLEAGEEVRSYRPGGYWLDIGRHDDYEAAQQEFEEVRDRLLPGGGG